VSAHFLPLAGHGRDEVYRRVARSVAPGGTLLLVTHDPTDASMARGVPAVADCFAAAAPMAAALPPDEWDVLVTGSRPRTVDDPEGGRTAIHDAVGLARRRISG
jgi:hypothetical protein